MMVFYYCRRTLTSGLAVKVFVILFGAVWTGFAGENLLDDGMIAHWAFDEIDENNFTPCSIRGSQKAEIVRSERIEGEFMPRLEEGIVGKALFCGGSGQFGYFATVEAPPRFEDEFTIAFWTRPRSGWMLQLVYYKRSWGDRNGFQVEMNGNRLSLMLGPAREKNIASELPLTLGKWAFIALTWDTAAWRMYINGRLVAEDNSGAYPHRYLGKDSPLVIGGYSRHTNNIYQGLMDEFRIWDRALTKKCIGEVMLSDLGDIK